MQQGLRWDAADVQADSAETIPTIDQDDGAAEIGGAECGGVAARATAEDEQIGLEIDGGHSVTLRKSASRRVSVTRKRAAAAPSITR